MKDPNKKVTFVFSCYENESAELKIRLRYDGLKQSTFFRSLLRMYITKDPLMAAVTEKIKLEQKVMGKAKLKKTKKDLEVGQSTLADLGISDTDREDLFDIIEMNMEKYE